MEIAKPAEAGSVDLSQLEERLLLFVPDRVETDVPTTYGPKNATVADLHVLDGPETGLLHADVFIWPKVLQSQLAPTVGTGNAVIGRLMRGMAKPGQQAPWKLGDPTPGDLAAAAAYVAEHANGDHGGHSDHADHGATQPEPELPTPPPASGIDQKAWDGMPHSARKAVADAVAPF